ncbi:MAG: hypothetical protein CVU11_10565 [Bacteroidetes bacterium HGW-Bacteroidetes-6]|jgi:PKD repeat protein|nr:MAG: hypothetical protein CVU11_10565 [Bacteroidetes bacterium HGW-Bacteroidetes-6]
MKKIMLAAVMLLLSCFVLRGQNNHWIQIDDYLLQKAVAEDEGLMVRYMMYEENIRQIQNATKTDTIIGGKRIIPVVFHVIHIYGEENISDAQIYDAIEKINIDYNKENADTADTYPLFQSRAANCQIEFRLAKIDPNGNCTSGIVRHYDPQTNYAYFSTMSDYAWTPSQYMNIFAVNFIYPEGMSLPDGAFIGGMSPFPPSNTLTQALTGGDTLMDGILIRQDGLGSIGTAENMGGMPLNMQNRTFTHETGHYFNLYHPFQSLYAALGIDGCGNFLFTAGDEVDDTPPVANATQNTSVNCFTPGSLNTCTNDSPDEPDMIENYMDYQFGYCNNIFSLGQLDRINTTLMNDRRKLWSYENLIATGVLDTSTAPCTPVADFFSETHFVCAGSTVNYFDASFNGAVDSWLWSFPGGNPSSSTDQNPIVSYSSPGTYAVTLNVYNATGNDALTKTAWITVFDTASVIDAPYAESFETINFANDVVVINDASSEWELNSGIGYTGSKCAYINNFDGNTSGSYDQLITPAFNLTSLPAGNHAKISFRYSYAGKITPGSLLTAADTAFDKLNVYVSTDCGKTWTNKISLAGATMGTSAPIETTFEPTTQTEWALKEIAIPSTQLPLYANTRLKFEFYANGGNNIYIDDISIYSISAGIGEYINEKSFSVFPNPVTDATNINFDLRKNSEVVISVIDANGREVMMIENSSLSSGSYSYPLPTEQLGAHGNYMINLSINGESLIKSVVF